MKLNIMLIDEFNYSSVLREFPVDVEVSTDESVEIYYPLRVNGAFITSVDDSDRCFGYSINVFPAKQEVVKFAPDEPIRMRVDVFEYEESFEGYVPGIYLCEIKVYIAEKIERQFAI